MARKSLVVSSILCLVLSCQSPVRAALIGHWTFDNDDVDGDTVRDVSGNALHGTKMNGGPETGVAGAPGFGEAAFFEGGSNNEDNQYVDLSDHADVFGQLSEGTLAAWVKPVTAEEAGNTENCLQDDVCHFTDVLTIFAASDSTQGSAEMRWVVHTATSPYNPVGPGGAANGSLYLGIRGADFSNHLISDVSDDVSLLDGQWHHVAVTVDGDNVGALYIDGDEVDSYYQTGDDIISFMADILPDGPDTVGIGRNKDSTAGGGQWFYHGLIDDMRVYDEALDAAAIQQLLTGDAAPVLWAGDADQDLDFDQLDLVQVQVAAKYLSGLPATWGEGDWNGAPGGQPGSPPQGNGLFDQVDIIAALAPAHYLTGPYAAIAGGGQRNDGQTSIVYDAGTGEVSVDAPAGAELTSINIDSASGIFTGDAAQNLGGSFDNDSDTNLFKATFGSSFGSLSFGNVAQAGLSEAFVLGDLTAVGSLAGGGDLGAVDLIYVPEPSTLVLMVLGLIVGLCLSGTASYRPKRHHGE